MSITHFCLPLLPFRVGLILSFLRGFPGGSDGKASACNAGDPGLISGLGRSPGEGNGDPLQYSLLESPVDGGAWWAPVHGVAKIRTRLSNFTFFLSSFYVLGQKLPRLATPTQSKRAVFSTICVSPKEGLWLALFGSCVHSWTNQCCQGNGV